MIKEEQLQDFTEFLLEFRDQFCKALEKVDGQSQFAQKTWQREGGAGGGVMSVLRGSTVEKAGANYSKVHWDKYPALESEYKGQPFMATGFSTIAHMYNPHAPIGHMNIRLLTVGKDFCYYKGFPFL